MSGGLMAEGDNRRPVWCEHCRAHFPTEHYADGKHQVGREFGPTGVELWILEAAAQVAWWWDPRDQAPNQSAEGWIPELQRRVLAGGRYPDRGKDVRG